MILSVLSLERVKQVTIVGFIVGLLLSPNLWASNSDIPRIPFIPLGLPLWVDATLFVCLLAVLVISFFKQNSIYIGTAIGIALVFLITDQMRIQPWVYFYLIILVAIFLTRLFHLKRENLETFLRIFIASVYIFSGLQKLNTGFISDLFPMLVNEFEDFAPSFILDNTTALAISVAVAEIAIGVCLLINRIQKLATIALILFISFLLLFLGPIGLDSNVIVWPWNITIAILTFYLFYNDRATKYEIDIRNKKSTFGSIAIIMFLLLPALNFFGLWDSYLSWSLYSGNVDTAIIKNDRDINVTKWAFDRYNVPSYPESRVYRQMFYEICKDDTDHTLVINKRSTLLHPGRTILHECATV